MPSISRAWPDGLAPDAVCLTVDVEWAHPVVLNDLVALFDAAGVAATFFVTHAGVTFAPQHERGLHPNFRRNGDTYRALLACRPPGSPALTDEDVHAFVLERTLSFVPEAKGIRSHCLYSETTMHWQFRNFGLEYDCSMRLPFVHSLRPVWQLHDVLGIPTYYADQIDLHTAATRFRVRGLGLDRPGLKVLDFHPNMVYLNAAEDSHYQATRPSYHDPDALLAARNPGIGVRTLLIELLEEIQAGRIVTTTVGEVNRLWREQSVDMGVMA